MATRQVIELEAIHLRDNRYAVRPKGCLGTCGWISYKDASIPWTVTYVNARNADEALRKAAKFSI